MTGVGGWWADGQTDGWMDGWVGGRLRRRLYKWTGEWMDDGWMNGWVPPWAHKKDGVYWAQQPDFSGQTCSSADVQRLI